MKSRCRRMLSSGGRLVREVCRNPVRRVRPCGATVPRERTRTAGASGPLRTGGDSDSAVGLDGAGQAARGRGGGDWPAGEARTGPRVVAGAVVVAWLGREGLEIGLGARLLGARAVGLRMRLRVEGGCVWRAAGRGRRRGACAAEKRALGARAAGTRSAGNGGRAGNAVAGNAASGEGGRRETRTARNADGRRMRGPGTRVAESGRS